MMVFSRRAGTTLKGVLAALTWLGASVSAPAAEPSPEAIKLAARILEDVGLKATVDAVVPYALGELERSVNTTQPEMKGAMHETVLVLTPELIKSASGVLDDVAHVMAARMSEADMKQTIAFFESEAGKKYTATQGPLLQQLSASGNAWRAQLSSTLLPRVREEMKKKGFEF